MEREMATEQRRSKRRLRQMTMRVVRLENNVHQAMAVLDTQTGKLLNYSQLIQDVHSNSDWASCHLTNHSFSGIFARLTGGRVGDKTKFQPSIVGSSMEADFMASYDLEKINYTSLKYHI